MNTVQASLQDLSVTRPRWATTLGGIRVQFGRGVRGELLEALRELGVHRPMLVTDPGVRAAGRVDALAAELIDGGLAPIVFDAVEENPTTDHVDRGTEAARAHETDGLVGIGGGSAMDVAKGINFIFSHGGRMEDYWGRGLATGAMLPSIGMPTTAGTGSEAQSFALIARVDDHRKMACGADGARFRTVLLDPELLDTVPRKVAVAAGLDAVSHAVESHVSTAANPISRLYSAAAWRWLSESLPAYLEGAGDPAAAGAMLLGAHLSGAAIECSMLGAAHACANPLTARFGMTHGLAVAVLLPHVVRYNAAAAAEHYEDLFGDGDDPATRLAALLSQGGVSERLREHGIEREALGDMATDAATQWTARFNPRPVGAAELLQIYEDAY